MSILCTQYYTAHKPSSIDHPFNSSLVNMPYNISLLVLLLVLLMQLNKEHEFVNIAVLVTFAKYSANPLGFIEFMINRSGTFQIKYNGN